MITRKTCRVVCLIFLLTLYTFSIIVSSRLMSRFYYCCSFPCAQPTTSADSPLKLQIKPPHKTTVNKLKIKVKRSARNTLITLSHINHQAKMRYVVLFVNVIAPIQLVTHEGGLHQFTSTTNKRDERIKRRYKTTYIL